ncbi:Histidine phosphatase superfamily (branch 1) [Pedobacter steynii]|uniref:Histidine phosphatase superfamily (Branch 1) n=1 Tax=Pedobacter steynii TaxID=430522 RepID=A0A1H0E2S1_9SPHI|nr:phosphoglycerate mutase family protein [Pedobacter steynii]NQX41904.1 histidine phosphatase family protein [Pedobacter steynii]SDN76646.1 Histidine phosphatase superfamily (branch 1) [Pedobacter steynii]
MKRILFIFLILITIQSVQAQETTRIWIVRHGEKDLTDPKEKDPELSAEGKERAEVLVKYLKGKKIDALFSTDYKRTRGTLTPLATQRNLDLKFYNSKENTALVDTILNNYKGQNVVICSHSNRILGIIAAFGAVSPIKEITEQEYSHLFLLEIKGGHAKLKHKHYGKL